MASRYWVGGTGNWDAADTTHWSASSGGAGGASVPGAADAVIFDANSGGGIVTVTADHSVISVTGGSFTGTLDYGSGRNLTYQTFNFSGTGTRILILGDASITLTGSNCWNIQTTTNLTFSGASSTLNFTGSFTGTLQMGSKTYGTINFTGAGDAVFSAFSCTNFNRTGTSVKTCSVTFAASTTVSGTLTLAGNSSINRVLVKSDVIGAARTLTAATVIVSNTDFQDITGAGAGSWDLSSITGNSGDCGGNSGITFTTPAAQIYTGGTGNWSDVTKWTSRVPLPQDDVSMSGVTGGTITADMPRMGKSIDWTGAAGTPALSLASTGNTVYGNWTFISGMTRSGTQGMTFAGRGTYSITNAGITWGGATTIACPGGQYTSNDDYNNVSGSPWTLTNGAYIDGGFSHSANNFSITGNLTRALTKSGNWTATSTGATTIWNATTTTGLTFSDTGSLTLPTSTNTRTFIGGGLTYGTLTYTVAGSTGGLDITGSNSFAAINFSDATNARTIRFTAGTITTIRNENGFNVQGTIGKLMTISSITAATHRISSLLGQVCDYLHLTNSIAEGGGSFYAGDESTDNGGNTGWIFDDPTFSANIFGDEGMVS